MQKRTLFSLTMLLCSGIAPVFAADLPKEVKAINQFREFRLDQGQIYELYVKTGDGVTTVTFPSAISKIAGVNVSVDGSSDFLISAKPGSYYFNIVALKKGATGTLTVIHNRQTYILYLKQDDSKAYAAVNFAASSGGSASVSNRGSAVSPARLLSLIDMTKGYHVLKQRYPSDLRDTIHAKNHRFFNFDKFRIELQEVVRFNREDTLVFKLLMHNDSPEEIAYDKFSFSVQAGNKTYYMSAADASGIMPPKSATWAFFSITGTPDGGRNNLAPDNNFLIGVTAKYMEEAYKIPQEINDPVVKRLVELANRLEKKLAEMESNKKVNEEKKEVKNEKKNEVPAVPPSVKVPAEKLQKSSPQPPVVLAPPAVAPVKTEPEAVKEEKKSAPATAKPVLEVKAPAVDEKKAEKIETTAEINLVQPENKIEVKTEPEKVEHPEVPKTPVKEEKSVAEKGETPAEPAPEKVTGKSEDTSEKVVTSPEEVKTEEKTEPSETKVSAEDREVSFWDFSEFPDNLYCLVSWMIFWK